MPDFAWLLLLVVDLFLMMKSGDDYITLVLTASQVYIVLLGCKIEEKAFWKILEHFLLRSLRTVP